MNYDQPRQVAEGDYAGKWHYTTGNRRTGIHPIGYCRDHRPHDTEAEARWCYTKYLFDHIEMRPHSCSWTTCGIKDCGKPADNIAQSGGWHTVALCDHHFNTNEAARAMGIDGPAGDSWHS